MQRIKNENERFAIYCIHNPLAYTASLLHCGGSLHIRQSKIGRSIRNVECVVLCSHLNSTMLECYRVCNSCVRLFENRVHFHC